MPVVRGGGVGSGGVGGGVGGIGGILNAKETRNGFTKNPKLGFLTSLRSSAPFRRR